MRALKILFLCLLHYLGIVMYEASDETAYMEIIVINIVIIISYQPRVKTLLKNNSVYII